jgi:hypothetical protein
MALSSALSLLSIKLVYVSEQTFPEFISIVLIASFIAQAIGAVLALKWKSYSAVRLLLLSLPAISTEYVFPFIRGEIIPITALTFLESIVTAYVFNHIRSIYIYIVSKDVYVNISVVQGVLTQASSSVMTIIISVTESEGDTKDKTNWNNIKNIRIGYPLQSGFDLYKGCFVDLFNLFHKHDIIY